MVIFNIMALFTALLVIVFSTPIFIIWHFDWIGESMAIILLCWVTLFTSIGMRQSNKIGHLFFIPIWILSIPLPFVATYMYYQWSGIGITLLIFASLIAGLWWFGRYEEQKRAENIELEEIHLPQILTNSIESWELIKGLIFLPSEIPFTREICSHNLRVIEKLEMEKVALDSLISLKEAMKNGTNSIERSFKIDATIMKSFADEIDNKIAYLEQVERESEDY